MAGSETRVTDPNTGGAKGQKPIQVGAYDPVALLALGRVAAMGAKKYDAFNYLKGYDWRLSFDAMMRHALAFWSGEDTDDESGEPHIVHAMWHAGALASFYLRGIGSDTRPTTQPLLAFERLDEVLTYLNRPADYTATQQETT